MDVEELIARSRGAASADQSWVGSDDHLALLKEFVDAEVAGVTVQWGAPGASSFVQGKTMTIEKPLPTEDPDMLERAALVLLHEVLHLKHTDDRTALPFKLKLDALRRSGKEPVAKYVNDVFQALEDVRIGNREAAASETNADHLRKFNRWTIEGFEQLYISCSGEPAWLLTPASSLRQSKLALRSRIYAPEIPRVTHPIVGQIIEMSCVHIDAAVAAPSSELPRQASFDIVDVVRSLSQKLN